jgi:hypothetical protein
MAQVAILGDVSWDSAGDRDGRPLLILVVADFAPIGGAEFVSEGCAARCVIVRAMSEKNGDKARFQKNRRRAVLRRAKARMLAAAASTEKPPVNSQTNARVIVRAGRRRGLNARPAADS